MNRRIAAIVLSIAACSHSPSGPKGLDPTVLITNTVGPDSVRLTWYDQSGQVAVFSVATGQSACVHFTSTQVADSVRFFVFMGDSTPGHTWSWQSSPWFDPKTGLGPDPTQYPFGAENWTLTVSAPFSLDMKAVDGAPCS